MIWREPWQPIWEGRVPTKRDLSGLLPPERNAVFVAIQAAMLAVTRDDPAAAKGCLEIALAEIKAWLAIGSC